MTQPEQKKAPLDQPRTLRDRAEALLRERPTDRPTLPTRDVQALIHELSVYQMELEIQNEELRRSQEELAHTRDRFADLYEFAPVGYLTLDRDGKVLEANLTAAALLEIDRKELIGTKISRFVERGNQDEYFLYRQDALDSDAKQTCEIRMHKTGGSPLTIRLEGTAYGAWEERRLRLALIDITDKQRAEEALQRLNEKLQHQAQTDDLTGLPNRAFFMTTNHQRFEHARRHRHPLAIFMIDLNKFKQVNDELGHAAGDQVLHAVASRLKKACRSGDILARVGGDEFALLVEDFNNAHDLISIAEKLGASIKTPIEISNKSYLLGLSIGIAILGTSDINEEALLKTADGAMYQAKREFRLYCIGGSQHGRGTDGA